MDDVIGIDFGSALCRMAVCRQGEVEVFSNRFSERALPVSLEAVDGAPLPVRVSGIKEELGSAGLLALGDRRLAPLEAAAEIFRDLAADAGEFTRGGLERAVVGVPACFLERQRAALQEAAERGGFRAVRLLDESVAALLSPEALRQDQTALVYSLGAGGFCASVARVERGAVRELCHEGQPGLGGHLLTAVVMAAILEHLPLSREQLRAAPAALSLLRSRAEQVKLGLSKRPLVEFDVNLRELFPPEAVPGGGASLSISLSREDFERRIAGYIDTTLQLAHAAVRGAGVEAGRIDSVLLLGGAARIPLVERRLREAFTAPLRRAPESAVASGLAWFGAQVPEAEWKAPEPRPEVKPEAPPSASQPAAAGSESWSEHFAPSFQEAQVQLHPARGAATLPRTNVPPARAFPAGGRQVRRRHRGAPARRRSRSARQRRAPGPPPRFQHQVALSLPGPPPGGRPRHPPASAPDRSPLPPLPGVPGSARNPPSTRPPRRFPPPQARTLSGPHDQSHRH
jgi:hypothetical protein